MSIAVGEPESMPMSIPRFGGKEGDELQLGQPDRHLNTKECFEVWQKAYGEGLLASHEMRGYRTVVAWRITRALGFRQGRMHLDERLHSAFPEPNDWKTPLAAGSPSARNLKHPADWSIPDLLSRAGGLALTPTAIAGHNTRFAAVVQALAESMWVQRGSTKIPRLGYYGLHGLTHPDTVGEHWPSSGEILAFEEQLVDQVKGFVLKWSRRKVQAHLKDLLDLTTKEAGGLMRMATEEAKAEATEDIDVKRFLMEGRLLDYIDRTQEDADPANEMKGLKMLSMVQGLTRIEPENPMEAFIGAIARVSSERSDDTRLRIELHDEEDDEDEGPTPKKET